MKTRRTYLGLLLGLLIAFPILFQSVHAFEHHILTDEIACCSHHTNNTSKSHDSSISLEAELDLCPILEYQIVYFPGEKQELPQEEFQYLRLTETPGSNHLISEFKCADNPLRGPPQV